MLKSPKRARGQTGTYAHFIPSTLTRCSQTVAKTASRPARRHEAGNAGQLQEQLGDSRKKHQGPTSLAGVHAQRNGHAHRPTIAACRQRMRSDRSYPRRSRKPVGKWRRGKATLTAAAE